MGIDRAHQIVFNRLIGHGRLRVVGNTMHRDMLQSIVFSGNRAARLWLARDLCWVEVKFVKIVDC